MSHRHTLHAALTERSLLKVIAGITNFDHDAVLRIARAAKAGGAQAVDVAADPALVAAVKAETGLVVFVSSTEPAKLIACAGVADVLELGNYDALYRAGIHPTRAQILDWAREVKQAVGHDVPLCVTVSGHLAIDEQRTLAADLQDLGVDILQTEGQVGPESEDTFAALSGAVSALGNTAEIRRVVSLPLLLAGGFNQVSAPFALAAGADALGVGKAVTRHADEAAMADEVRALVAALRTARAEGKGLASV
jgi:imidazole glycerol phosphate synthase subunit HisF